MYIVHSQNYWDRTQRHKSSFQWLYNMLLWLQRMKIIAKRQTASNFCVLIVSVTCGNAINPPVDCSNPLWQWRQQSVAATIADCMVYLFFFNFKTYFKKLVLKLADMKGTRTLQRHQTNFRACHEEQIKDNSLGCACAKETKHSAHRLNLTYMSTSSRRCNIADRGLWHLALEAEFM